MLSSRKTGLAAFGMLAVSVEIAATAVFAAPQTQTPTPVPTPKLEPKDAAAVGDFSKRVDAYVVIHTSAEKTLPTLPKEATPKQIDQKQRDLATKIQAARPNARRGDLFTPEMAGYVKRLMVRVFSGKDGAQLRASIQDENVKYLPLKVNQRYPDEYPLTTMPPDVLKALPQLPEEMEYRFVGPQLILLDTHAHVIPDFVPDALPETATPATKSAPQAIPTPALK
jgi:hypothetical protein